MNSPLGYAEQLSFGGDVGSNKSNTIWFNLTKPRPYGRRMVVALRTNQLYHSYQQWSSYNEKVRGSLLSLASENGTHALTYEAAWRQLSATQHARPSAAVQAQLGDQLKSALHYVWRRTSSMGEGAGNSGTSWGVRSSSEVAGLGPDSNLLRFFKQQVTGQVS